VRSVLGLPCVYSFAYVNGQQVRRGACTRTWRLSVRAFVTRSQELANIEEWADIGTRTGSRRCRGTSHARLQARVPDCPARDLPLAPHVSGPPLQLNIDPAGQSGGTWPSGRESSPRELRAHARCPIGPAEAGRLARRSLACGLACALARDTTSSPRQPGSRAAA
jgi:hypothetical protein